ncbi:hypothetical protein PROFUN_14689 [Planoprotostelium fungivorum]|uniref:t-SNARE coiled-coil homology domain-containing protein n=1 Tax=Planoprotostelium fungivorum TaxID=1890364 RepID=A0A2P6MZ79_9EUKA|nr:hypothetical protein PROFUN_14689 [Planoprotostelium fungivorum]
MSMDYFDDYEQEFVRKSKLVRERLNALPNLSGERRKTAITDTQKVFNDAKRALSQMEEEGSKNTKDKRRKVKLLEGYRGEFGRLQRDMEMASLSESSRQRDQYGYDDGAGDSRQRLLQADNTLDESKGRLTDIHRISEETNNLGADTLTTMGRQKNQLTRARDNLGHIEENISRSRRILRAINRRVVTNNIVLTLIAVVLLAIILLIVFIKWGRGLLH